MPEMTRHDRILSASRRQPTDRLPFFHFWRHSQIGWAEREARNRGMGICWNRPCCAEKIHDAEITDKQISVRGETLHKRTYDTPVGSVWVTEKREPGTGQWHGNRSWNDVSPWQTERLIKEPEDYEVVKFMVEHTEYVPDPFPLEQAMDWLGGDGVVICHLPHSPMQTLMIDWVGSESGRIFYHLEDHREVVEDLYTALCKKRRELHAIAAKSPAPIVLCGDNVDGVLVTPSLFERYFMPVYKQQAEVLHANGKLMAVHMDGRLKVLKDLIARTSIDIIEAVHPPPMGDLPVSEALAAWPDKSIWVGFPSAIYDLGREATRDFTLDLLRDAGTGERLVVEVSTENIVSNENLITLSSVLDNADLPLSEETVTRIAESLAR